MSEFKKYSRMAVLAEMRPYVKGEDLTHVSVSEVDKQYFKDNFTEHAG